MKQLEVNFIRPVERFTSEEIHCIHHSNPKMFNCWVIEFSLKVDTSTKLVNGMNFDQTMTEGKDFLILIIFVTFKLSKLYRVDKSKEIYA